MVFFVPLLLVSSFFDDVGAVVGIARLLNWALASRRGGINSEIREVGGGGRGAVGLMLGFGEGTGGEVKTGGS